MTRYIDLNFQLETALDVKAQNVIRDKIKKLNYLRGPQKYLDSNHVYRLGFEVDSKASMVIEEGAVRYIRSNNFFGPEVTMTGKEALDRNKVLEDKFAQSLKKNQNAKLMRWHMIRYY